MLNRLNILHWIWTAADKFSSAFSSKCFCSKEDKILIKNLRQLKGYTVTRFLKEFRTNNWTKHKFWQFWKELLCKLIILLNKPCLGLLCANYVVRKFTGDLQLQRFVTIWNICVQHGSALTWVRWGEKWVHLI